MTPQSAERIAHSDKIRRAMLAKIHIAKKELGLKDYEYRDILERFNVITAADLRHRDLEELIKLFRSLGWQAKPDAKIKALRQRVIDEVATITNGANRLPGLVKKICGAERLEWCHSVNALERLLAVITKISEGEKTPHLNPLPSGARM